MRSKKNKKKKSDDLPTQDEFRQSIESSPAKWAKDVYGVSLWEKQVEIVNSVFKHRRTAIKGCVASSKTVAAAVVTHAWLQRYSGSKVFMTAPSDRQVKGVLWAEVRSLFSHSRINLGGNMLPSDSRWDVGENWFALGFSTNDPNRFHGLHAGIFGQSKKILFIVDEAQGIDQPTFDAIENVLSDGLAHLLILQNPGSLTGEAHAAFHQKRSMYNCITISATDTPNYQQRKVVIPGMITYEQCEEWRRVYGETSNFYRVKVLAEFPLQEADTLIPMNWIELAMSRDVPQEGQEFYGCDVAWEGDDDSVIARLRGRQVHPLEVYHGKDPSQIADSLDIHLARPGAMGFVDGIGIGAGVYSREAQRGRRVHNVIVSEDAVGRWENRLAKDHFFNLRAQIAWVLRCALDPSNPRAIALPKDLELQAQMSAIKYKTDETTGKVRLQSKKDMKKILGYSPDKFDAVALAVWGAYLQEGDVTVLDWIKETNAVKHVSPIAVAEAMPFDIPADGCDTIKGLGQFNEAMP